MKPLSQRDTLLGLSDFGYSPLHLGLDLRVNSTGRASLTLSAIAFAFAFAFAFALVGWSSHETLDRPLNILFVGNSYTFARVAPALN